MPPAILIEPDADIVFDPRVNLELPCLAMGEPTPVYTWIKNGQVYNPNTRVIQANDSGLLTFNEPEIVDQGYYQCNATNTWGKLKNRNCLIERSTLGKNFRYSNVTEDSCTSC